MNGGDVFVALGWAVMGLVLLRWGRKSVGILERYEPFDVFDE